MAMDGGLARRNGGRGVWRMGLSCLRARETGSHSAIAATKAGEETHDLYDEYQLECAPEVG